jgi:hypothetical protein
MEEVRWKVRFQVRRLSENDCRRALGKKWQVVGRTKGWPAHFTTATKAEAQYRKARKLAGLDWIADGGFTKLGNAFIDRDGVWTV